ncbi:hypothetical protein V8F06_003007, partial [Rhypophila decipiens]
FVLYFVLELVSSATVVLTFLFQPLHIVLYLVAHSQVSAQAGLGSIIVLRVASNSTKKQAMVVASQLHSQYVTGHPGE